MLLPRQGMLVRVVVKGVTEPRCGGLAPGVGLSSMTQDSRYTCAAHVVG